MDAVFLFVTMVIPKAGAVVLGLPLTLNLLLLLCVVMVNVNHAILAVQSFRDFGAVYVMLGVFIVTTMCLSLAFGVSPFQLSQMLVVLISPLAAVSVKRIRPELMFKLVCVAVIVVNVYGMIQFIGGISRMTIPGLTATYGQNIEMKNIGYDGSTDGGNKIPSTYQNGNSVGIFNVLAVSYLLSFVSLGLWKRTRILGIMCGLVGLLLCGSRSILIPFVVAFAVMITAFLKELPKGRRTTATTVVTVGSLVLFVLLAFQRTILEQFWQRNIWQTIEDPTAAGRTGQWASSIKAMHSLDLPQLLRLFTFGKDSSMQIGGEGLPAFFFTFGIVATVLFYGGLVLVVYCCWNFRSGRPLALGLLCVVVAFCVDTTYFYPPNLMMFFIFAMTVVRVRDGESNPVLV
ncbi:hypothetical protein [Bifidobacterium crudilactis]|uniref:O-antigen ligase family protein n=1 Tax=Bifidobacterium crudilactis TaxID=327277 RepID=UPI002F35E983